MKKIVLSLATFLITTLGFGQDISGEWNGILEAMKLRIVIHIEKTNSGYSATLDSPDQGAKDIPVTETSFENETLNLKMTNLNATFEGSYTDGMFSGTFIQNGLKIPLTLQREAIEKEVSNRPQEPKEPYPYLSEELTFENTDANITLAATLTYPSSEEKYPVVILISGSGPQDRNEELVGHKPFLVLSDHLTRKGIAVLRFDDRGVGKSTGDFGSATSADFATDVASAVSYLKTRKEIDITNIGLIGHSEGGVIAPIVASETTDVAFIVLLAGTGIPGDELLLLQQNLIGNAMGMSEKQLGHSSKISGEAFKMITSATDTKKLKIDLKERMITAINAIPDDELPIGVTKDESSIKMQVDQLTSPWMIYFMKHDPSMVLQKVKCPILAVNGAKDLQVPPTENLEPIKAAAIKGGNRNVTTVEFPNLNHLFQECQTGAPGEYGIIEQTFAPIALETVSDWIMEQVK